MRGTLILAFALISGCTTSWSGTGNFDADGDASNIDGSAGHDGASDDGATGDGDVAGIDASVGDGDGDGSLADGTPADGSDGDGDGDDGDGMPADGAPEEVDAGPPVMEPDPWRRPLTMTGRAVSFAPYRAGQSPDRESWDPRARPSAAQILEDLQILSRHFRNIRTYAAGAVTEDAVRLIHEHQLPIKVMVGAWLAPETSELAKATNEAECARAVSLANAFPDVVGAVSVGNEVLIDWSTHKVSLERVVYFVRKVREQVTVPVTVADNYVWWRDQGATLAEEVDFLVIHTYPFWEQFDIDLQDPNDRRAIKHTIDNLDSVKARYPRAPVVIGEAGWATADNGDPLIVPHAGSEAKQKVYYQQLDAWAEETGALTFVFSAFDEKWKGGPDASEPEKNWGLFFENRTPKEAMKALYPDLQPTRL